ncbi:MAG: type II secretion system secretin GspD [Pseudolabrys sp.]
MKEWWKSTMGSTPNGPALVTLALLAVLLAGCVTSGGGQGLASSPQPAFVDQIREVDLTPPPRQHFGGKETIISKSIRHAEIYNGDGTVATLDTQSRSASRNENSLDSAIVNFATGSTGALPHAKKADMSNKGYQLNFENTPVETVAKAILGDILGLGYTIDPRVKGTVSLSSGRAIPRKDLLFVLESALRMSNIALVHGTEGYRLIPTNEALATGSADWARDPSAGYGISVIPLQFVSAQTLVKLLQNYAAKPGMVRAEPSRNLIIIQGTSEARRAAIRTVLSFDADWMRGQSVGIYPVNNSTPEPIILELNHIIDAGRGGLSQDLIKLEPIDRQNAILVVTRERALLQRVARWITRLDKSGGAGTALRVYRMRYGDARKVATLLNDMFVGGNTSGLDSPKNQLSPGAGSVALSSPSSQTLGNSQPDTTAAHPSSPDKSKQASPSLLNTHFSSPRVAGPATSETHDNGLFGSNSGALPPILPNVRIAADAVNNSLLIYANQESYGIIKRALQQIDRPQLQVAIDATIAEVTLNHNLQYGVQFFLKSVNLGAPAHTGSLVNTAAKAVLSRVLPGFNFLMGTEASPQLIINALHAVTDVKILSNPSLVVVDNQTATLQVGDAIPITTQSAQSVIAPGAPVVSNVEYRNTGIILKVAPRINAHGNVLLHIAQEISAVTDNGNSHTLTPTVSERRVESSISVASGQTVLLAGLISEQRDHHREGIPGLDRIPGIGPLLSTYNSGTHQRTELIIFIRPQIIRNGIDAYHVAERLRDKILRSRHGIIPPQNGTFATP